MIPGDAHSIVEQLFKKESRNLFYYCMKIVEDKFLAEDAVSHAYIKLFIEFDKIEKKDVVYTDYLYTCAYNKCLNEIKHLNRRRKSHGDIIRIYPEESRDLEERIIYADILKIVLEELEKLPKLAREIFKMSVMESMSTKEICEKLNVTPQNVINNKSRAMALLKLNLYHKLQ